MCRRSRPSDVPTAGATEVTQWIVPVATFNEAVQGVSSATVRLRDMETHQLVPASVSYDSARREARLTPAARPAGQPPVPVRARPPGSRTVRATRWPSPAPASRRATMRSGTSRARHTPPRSSGSRSDTSCRAADPSGSARRATPAERSPRSPSTAPSASRPPITNYFTDDDGGRTKTPSTASRGRADDVVRDRPVLPRRLRAARRHGRHPRACLRPAVRA